LEGIARREGIVANSESLLDPKFYISPQIEPQHIANRLRSHALKRRSWIVPNLGIRCDQKVLDRVAANIWPTWRALLPHFSRRREHQWQDDDNPG
jgi:hypothetical protein